MIENNLSYGKLVVFTTYNYFYFLPKIYSTLIFLKMFNATVFAVKITFIILYIFCTRYYSRSSVMSLKSFV